MTKSVQLYTASAANVAREIGPSELGGENWSVVQRTLHGGLREGVETLTVSNGSLRVEIVPTRGMGIWKAWRDLPGGNSVELGWKSPVRGPVHPAFVDLGEPSGLGWLDGFDELLVRCGLVSNGAPEFDTQTGRLVYPLHGRIANKPAQEVEVSFNAATQTVSVSGIVEETRFHFTKLRMKSTINLQLGSNVIQVRDEVLNFSESAAEIQMLYHVNFGQPLLDGGSQLLLPFKALVPRNAHAATGVQNWHQYAPPQPGTQEQVYLCEMYANAAGETCTLLKNAKGNQGVSLRYNVQQLPCYTVWKNTTGERDGYVTGLEPGTNYPNPRSFEGEHGRVVKLAPNGTQTFDVSLEVHATTAEVQAAEQAVQAIVAQREQKIFNQPQPHWCA